jgi:hypothetical protein
MDKVLLDEFLCSFDDSRYPPGFLQDYETLECLSNNPVGETLLVKDRQTDQLFIAKCYANQSLLAHTTESDLLKRVDHERLPAFIKEYKNAEMLCVVREYVEGIPLDKYAAEFRLTQKQIISLGIQLCDDISYLHDQNPPIIHRDIKPQNIVIDKEGSPRLIDFGSSRIYDEGAEEDTVCFGTKYFAAPEQYGFSQTDCRSDIYSMGVLFCWLLTGETEIKTAVTKIGNKNLRRIVQKCTAFAPENRYASAVQVKKALLLADGQKQTKLLQTLCAVLAGTFLLISGFVVGRYTEFSPAFLASPGVHFEEPLVEQAVRSVLNIEGSELITEEELLNVTELYIYGDQAAGNYAEFEAIGQHMALNDGTVHNGGISSLKDLARLKNLRRLNIALENISDLSPLEELAELEEITLKHNPVEDISPLAKLPSLRELFIYDTHVADLSVLSTCPALEKIDVGQTNITSLTALTGIKSLTDLYAKDIMLESLAGIENYPYLQHVSFSRIADGDLSPLMKLPQLKEVRMDESLRGTAEVELKQAQFQIIYQ